MRESLMYGSVRGARGPSALPRDEGPGEAGASAGQSGPGKAWRIAWKPVFVRRRLTPARRRTHGTVGLVRPRNDRFAGAELVTTQHVRCPTCGTAVPRVQEAHHAQRIVGTWIVPHLAIRFEATFATRRFHIGKART